MNTPTLNGRAIAVPPDADELAAALKQCGAQVVAWPRLEISEPADFTLLDQALDNLFGYDWLVFANPDGAEFFLRRFESLGHEMHELDGLRVCAATYDTALRLADAHIHVDVTPAAPRAGDTLQAIADYLGGADNLALVNFLLPAASSSRWELPRLLEAGEARADVVAAFRTTPPHDAARPRFEALLHGGALDAIVFPAAEDVANFARLFDTFDLDALLQGLAVACGPDAAHNPYVTPAIIADDLAAALAAHFQTI
jgi:uroporphyrinogen III methyltransferase/synthase